MRLFRPRLSALRPAARCFSDVVATE
jgi:hypothetical protein